MTETENKKEREEALKERFRKNLTGVNISELAEEKLLSEDFGNPDDFVNVPGLNVPIEEVEPPEPIEKSKPKSAKEKLLLLEQVMNVLSQQNRYIDDLKRGSVYTRSDVDAMPAKNEEMLAQAIVVYENYKLLRMVICLLTPVEAEELLLNYFGIKV